MLTAGWANVAAPFGSLAYVKDMRLIKTYAGDVELQALCDVLNCCIYVYGSESAPEFKKNAPKPVDFNADLFNSWMRLIPTTRPNSAEHEPVVAMA